MRVVAGMWKPLAIGWCLLLVLLPAAACTRHEPAATEAAAPAQKASSPPTAGSHVVSGRIPPVTAGVTALLFLESKSPHAFPPAEGKAIMDQAGMQFSPSVLFVRAGQPVVFRNSDNEMHNVNLKESASRGQAFNVAIPTGGTYEHVFERDGLYDVSCDVHSAMSATILVTSTPYATIAERDGSFTFGDVAPGSYRLMAYSGPLQFQRSVEVTQALTTINVDQ
jgi:plastocyanin